MQDLNDTFCSYCKVNFLAVNDMETPPTTPQCQHNVEHQNERNNHVMRSRGDDPFMDVDADGQASCPGPSPFDQRIKVLVKESLREDFKPPNIFLIISKNKLWFLLEHQTNLEHCQIERDNHVITTLQYQHIPQPVPEINPTVPQCPQGEDPFIVRTAVGQATPTQLLKKLQNPRSNQHKLCPPFHNHAGSESHKLDITHSPQLKAGSRNCHLRGPASTCGDHWWFIRMEPPASATFKAKLFNATIEPRT
ncbi:hypothetical protein C8J56DRAFT_1049766 [Mycena floridula]|nr:hypothetical protein C8J56DRAFT_1049766 [Mycena floridula]